MSEESADQYHEFAFPDCVPTSDALEPHLLREKIMEAMLAACGELGYRNVAIRHVLARYGGHRVQFYGQFTNKDDCFVTAHDVWTQRLCDSLLAAAKATGEWQAGMQAALVKLFQLVNTQPAIARALLIEPQVAGGEALARREAALERLAKAVDSARREVDPEKAPPSVTARFIVGGVEMCVCGRLASGTPEQVWDSLPELMRVAVGPYFGEEAAQEAYDAAHEYLSARNGHRR